MRNENNIERCCHCEKEFEDGDERFSIDAEMEDGSEVIICNKCHHWYMVFYNPDDYYC